MGILYKNPNPIRMKTVSEITQEDYDQFVSFIGKTDWTTNEMNSVVSISRLYVNPRTPSCLTCSSYFRESLNNVRAFFLNNRAEMELILSNKQQPESSINITEEPQNGKKVTTKRSKKG